MYRSHPQQENARSLRAVTARVVDSYTRAGLLFTSLDVSNAVKQSLPWVRHREVAALVRERYARGKMGDYARTAIDVLAGGATPTTAFLYHAPYAPTDYYDDAMRSQLAAPPAAAPGAEPGW